MLFGDRGERIKILGPVVRDWDGTVRGFESSRDVNNCVVYPSGATSTDGVGMVHGDENSLDVLAPPGTEVSEGDTVDIRGVKYTVKFIPFDFSVARRPAVAHHRPRVKFTVERGDAHDHL